MTNGHGQGGGEKPPPDDRTLLDPLKPDELRALREARQRMEQQKKRSAVAHQVVIGPDAGDDIGDAPTRAMPALPSFDAGISLEAIGTGNGAAPTAPAPKVEARSPPAEGPAPSGGSGAKDKKEDGPPQPGQPGFGENTLLWMAPPKVPPGGAAPMITTGDLMGQANPKDKAMRLLKTAVFVLVIVGVLAAVFAGMSSQERGIIELYTTPPKAKVTINGKVSPQQSPVKLTLPSGTHEFVLSLEGYEPHKMSVEVQPGEKSVRKDVDLVPISKPGLLTVSIDVSPIASKIVVDDQIALGKRSVKLANLDPKKPHKITVEAGGYVKIEQMIPAGKLKASYNFVLQRDKGTP